jgi:hypothetical protein
LPLRKNRVRIPKAWVPLLAKKIIENCTSKDLFKPIVSIEKVLLATEEIILSELTIEDRLNEEVRELLKSHAREIEHSRLDYRKLFELTKQKLVKERNLVL